LNNFHLAFGDKEVETALNFVTTNKSIDESPFEFVYPEIGTELANALEQQPEAAAIDLLRIAGMVLGPIWSQYPYENVRVIKRTLGWVD
jgi:hypothetical protein